MIPLSREKAKIQNRAHIHECIMIQKEKFPVRKKLPHSVPDWVPRNSRYFITINCKKRGDNTLCFGSTAQSLIDSIPAYEELRKWWMHLFVVMPDHVHMIVTFSKLHGIKSVIKTWKSYHARTLGIDWQSDYFEHRLRNEDEFFEKASYVRLNPVRRELVSDWTHWPYLFQRGLWTESTVPLASAPGRAKPPAEPRK